MATRNARRMLGTGLLALPILGLTGVLTSLDAAPLDDRGERRRGGPVSPQPAIGEPLLGLDPTQRDRFDVGRTLFSTVITVEDGQGPLINKTRCGSCHSNPTGGPGNISVTHFGQVDKGEFVTLPGGTLRQLVAIAAGCEEVVPPEANFTTTRITPGMLGFGLVEAIPDADIAANADPTDSDADGVSGRVHWVEDLAAPAGSPLRAGRFGWKSIIASIEHFSGDAALMEMGLTNQIIGEETAPNGDLAKLALCDDVPDPEDHPDLEGFTFVDRVTHFQRYLAPPPQSPRSGMSGEAVFTSIGCATCHTPSFTTSNDPSLEAAIRGVEVRPYSDFLLHDMGLLGDGLPQGDATANEFRTTPLMGVARREAMLHDGRVSGGTIESRLRQAILAHGPFGEASDSASAFAILEKDDEAALLSFLKSLGRTDFDFDDDDVVGLEDWSVLLACSSIDVVITPDMPCGIGDVDQDGDVDSTDLQTFLLAFDGENGDCDGDGETDLEEIFAGAPDADGDGIPDDCPEPCPGDFNGDGEVSGGDLGLLMAAWGPCGGCPADLDGDGFVGGADLGLMTAGWGTCP